ncbi:MAG TPA: hypothetical protein VF469_18745 [Kofleriaceae bacterium]
MLAVYFSFGPSLGPWFGPWFGPSPEIPLPGAVRRTAPRVEAA